MKSEVPTCSSFLPVQTLSVVLLAVLLGACGGESGGSPVEVEEDPPEIVLREQAVAVDSTVLDLVSDSAEREAGEYRFQVMGQTPEIEEGDVIGGAQDDGFLRRVTDVAQTGDTLTLQTSQAALTDAVERGGFSATVSVDPTATSSASARGDVRWGPSTLVGDPSGVEVTRDGITLDNTAVYDGEVCADGGNGCVDLAVVIDSGVVAFSHEVDVAAQIASGRVESAHAVATGSLQLDASVSAAVSGAVTHASRRPLFVVRTPFVTAIGGWPVVGVIETAFVVEFTVEADGSVDASTGFESTNSLSVGGRYEGGSWSAVFHTDQSYADRPTDWAGEVALDVRLSVRPEDTIWLYGVAGGFIGLGPYLDFSGTVDEAEWQARLAAGLAAEMGMRLRILWWDLVEWSYEPISSEIVLFEDGGVRANIWTQLADFGGNARSSAVGFVIDAKAYLGLGRDGSGTYRDFWAYDVSTDTWTQKADFGGSARNLAVGFTIGGRGYVGTGYDGAFRDDFWEYDPSSNTWREKARFGGTARYAAIAFSIGNRGYIGTGRDQPQGGAALDFWEYDPLSDSWTRKADFGGGRRSMAVGFSLGGQGYAGTGNAHPGLQRDFWRYDPSSNAWTRTADFGGIARWGAVAFAVGDRAYVGTGSGSGSNLSDIWEYDPTSDVWARRADVGGPGRYSAVGFSIGTHGYVGTGLLAPGGTPVVRDFWRFDPGS